MGPCRFASSRHIWRITRSVLRTERGSAPHPGVYRLGGPQQVDTKKKAKLKRRPGPLLYVLPLGARVALLRSPVLSKASRVYHRVQPHVHGLAKPGCATSAYVAPHPRKRTF